MFREALVDFPIHASPGRDFRLEVQGQTAGKDCHPRFSGAKIEPGMMVTAQTEGGEVNLVVTEVDETTVTVDANHPLAGKSLKFEVRVEAIRDASEEELSHGHVHGPGGHDHG